MPFNKYISKEGKLDYLLSEKKEIKEFKNELISGKKNELKIFLFIGERSAHFKIALRTHFKLSIPFDFANEIIAGVARLDHTLHVNFGFLLMLSNNYANCINTLSL